MSDQKNEIIYEKDFLQDSRRLPAEESMTNPNPVIEGVWNKTQKSYSNRLVVFTDQI